MDAFSDFKRNTSAGYLANHMARVFALALDAELQPLGLRLGAFPALLLLWEGDGLTQRDLVRDLDIEQPTMAATLTRMERDGLIRRSRDETDGRAQRIRLTARGRALEAPAKAAAQRVNAIALRGFAESERDDFLQAMRRVIANFETGSENETGSKNETGAEK